MMEWELAEESEELDENLPTLLLCPPQNTQDLTWNQNQAISKAIFYVVYCHFFSNYTLDI